MKTPPPNSIALMSDVHGKYSKMHDIIRQTDRYPFILQMGDCGFRFDTLDNVDPNRFVINGGNHDNYDKIVNVPHYLGDYGWTTINGVSFFFMRGAYSIDKMYRTVGIDWWEQEELTPEVFEEAKKLYTDIKPDIVITHDAPDSIASLMLKPWQQKFNNFTGYALQQLLDIHRPKNWWYAHWHVDYRVQVDGTKFYCMRELGVTTINQLGEPVRCLYCGVEYDKSKCSCGNQWV